MHFSILSAACAAAFAVHVAASPASNYVLHEKRHAEPRHWNKRDRLNRDVLLPMRIGMTQSNLDRGDDLLMEVSMHDSPKFSEWYTEEEINSLFAPSQDTVAAVRSWLESAGIASHRIGQSVNKQWMQFDAKVHEVEELLKTEYYQFEHKSDKSKLNIGCDEYHVPAHVQEHIDYITPGLKLLSGGKKSHAKRNEKRGFRTGPDQKFSGPVIGNPVTQNLSNMTNQQLLAECDQFATPICIATMYNITQATKAAKGNELGIFEEGDFYSETDLAEFFALLAPNIPATTMPILQGVDGGFAPSAVAGGESDLDLQISYPIIYPQNSKIFQTDDIFYATGLEGGGGFLNTFLDAIDGSYCNYTKFGEKGNAAIDPVYPDPNPAGYQGQLQCGVYAKPNVISISYGEQEDDLPTNYQQRQCSEFMKLGMQGLTVVLASGDSGVAARSTDDNNADGCLGNGEVFNPDFPASCPYLSAVGATYLPPGGNVYKDQEVAVTPLPKRGWILQHLQETSLPEFCCQHLPDSSYPDIQTYNTSGMNNPPESVTKGGIYNIAGRGYPDFSAIGDNVLIILDGTPQLIGGTSASAPVFASIINRVNEERLAVGKKTVGFVNPTLYSHQHVFNDITVGNNSGCGTPGFYAAKGWDPLTGLGTPNYPAILKLYMGLK